MIKKCKSCGNLFNQTHPQRVYCKDKECFKKRRRQAVMEYTRRHIDRVRERWERYRDKKRGYSYPKNLIKKCKSCGNEFKPEKYHPQQECCNSKECLREKFKRNAIRYRDKHRELINWKRRRYKDLTKERRICKNPLCNKQFIPKTAMDKYCSSFCRNKKVYSDYYKRHYQDKIRPKIRRYRQTQKGKEVHRLDARKREYEIREKLKKIHPPFLAKSKLSANALRFIRQREGDQCVYCGKKIKESTKREDTFDHIISLEKGGTNDINNIVRCCSNCNASKQEREVHEWFRLKFSDRTFPEKINELLEKYTKEAQKKFST